MSRPPSAPRLLASVLAAAALGALACSGGEPPAYTRLDGPAPAVVDPTGAVLVTFWASWCPPCVEELPGLRALAKDPPAGVAIVTFGEDEDEAARAHFGGAPPAELRYRRDAGRSVAEAFGVEVLPAAFLVVNGRLVARFDGRHDWGARGMRRLLARLSSDAPPPGAAAASRVDAPRADR